VEGSSPSVHDDEGSADPGRCGSGGIRRIAACLTLRHTVDMSGAEQTSITIFRQRAEAFAEEIKFWLDDRMREQPTLGPPGTFTEHTGERLRLRECYDEETVAQYNQRFLRRAQECYEELCRRGVVMTLLAVVRSRHPSTTVSCSRPPRRSGPWLTLS